jgi:hypothetical protein
MKKISRIFMAIILMSFSVFSFADETIIMIRHGEKPEQGLGQLTCQGLNRSLALTKVLVDKYGKPDFIFAPNPSVLKNDKGVFYSYIRPLATIEPTAIRLGIPVNLKYSFEDFKGIEDELNESKYSNSIIFIAWEHHLAVKIAKELTKKFDNVKANEINGWNDDDFDSIYVIRISNKEKTVEFSIDNQNLNYLFN